MAAFDCPFVRRSVRSTFCAAHGPRVRSLFSWLTKAPRSERWVRSLFIFVAYPKTQRCAVMMLVALLMSTIIVLKTDREVAFV